jgi:predicted peptidase
MAFAMFSIGGTARRRATTWTEFGLLALAAYARCECAELAIKAPSFPSAGNKAASTVFVPLEQEDGDRVVAYRLFSPRKMKSSVKYPLLLWLHGRGQSGNDNRQQLMHIEDEVARWQSQKQGLPCFVLAPQSPYIDHWGEDMLSAVVNVIHRMILDRPVDEDRIYAAGVSTGGTACWRLGATFPEEFAALAPMASRGLQRGHAALRNMPIWAFHTTDDAISPDGVRATVAAIRQLGGPCWLTETPGDNHDCWTAAFRDYEVIEWLMQQSRNSPVVSVSIGDKLRNLCIRYWDRVWPPAMTVAAGVLFVIIIKRHYKRNAPGAGFLSATVIPPPE